MVIGTSRRALRGAALVAVPAALWAFAANAYACDVVTITATEDCDHVVVKGIEAGNQEQGTLDVKDLNGHVKKTVHWKADGRGDMETIATVKTDDLAPGTYTVTLEESTDLTATVAVGSTCPECTTCPKPPANPPSSPSPKLTTVSSSKPTPTPAGLGHGTPGLPNTGVAPQ